MKSFSIPPIPLHPPQASAGTEVAARCPTSLVEEARPVPALHQARSSHILSSRHWLLQLMTVASFNYIDDLEGRIRTYESHDSSSYPSDENDQKECFVLAITRPWVQKLPRFQALGAKARSPIRPPITTPFRLQPLTNNLILRLLFISIAHLIHADFIFDVHVPSTCMFLCSEYLMRTHGGRLG